jgi:trehalose synthase
MYERLSGEHAPYNLRFVTNGVSCTTTSIIAAALNIRELDAMSDADKLNIRQIHVLLAMYNALQPGVFAISGWDLVGALPLPIAQVEERMADGDTRWIHRGSYDLAGANPEATASQEGLPRATCLYGSLPEQLADPSSFASQLKHLLAVREAYKIASSKQIAIPDVASPGLLVMVHELPAGKGTQVTALNFGATSVEETIVLSGVSPGPVVDMIAESVEGDLNEQGELRIRLKGYQGTSLRVVSALPTGISSEPEETW